MGKKKQNLETVKPKEIMLVMKKLTTFRYHLIPENLKFLKV
jgi:hypothetical protein